MRCLALSTLVFLGVAACSSTSGSESQFLAPNELMGKEIEHRVAQIPYQHREELFNNLLWLSQTGEQAIPALLEGLGHPEPKVRSNCAWVLARIGDRRTIPQLRRLVRDPHETVRLEAARTLVMLGDMKPTPTLIEGLDSDLVQVRYLCHEALKNATGRDFNYDHLSDDQLTRTEAVFQWRQWWSAQSGDQFFADEYARQKGLNAEQPNEEDETWPIGDPAAPGGETDPDRTQPENQPIEVPDEGVIGTTPPSEPPAENKPKGWQGGAGS